MSETITATLPLQRWQGERGTYHLVTFTGAEAKALSAHALMERLELGQRRGFGSIKLTARLGETQWRTSVFPQKKALPSNSEPIEQTEYEWMLLVSKKVLKAEMLAPGETIKVTLTL